MVLWELLVSWGRIGLVGYGGGPAMIPLMKAECVDVRGWLTEAQFMEGLAVSNALPGPITAKMSVFVGWKMAGGAGAGVSCLAVVAPAAFLMLALMGVLLRYREAPAVAGGLRAVKPVVIGMLVWTVATLWTDAVQGWSTALLAGAALVALLLKVHPGIVVVVALVVGALFLR